MKKEHTRSTNGVVFHLFGIRCGYNTSLTLKLVLGIKAVLISLALVSKLQVLFTYASFTKNILYNRVLTLNNLLLALFTWVGIAVFTIIELEKHIRLEFRRIKEV